MLRLAQGLDCKASAAVAGLSFEMVRTVRKRIYRKLGVPGAGALLAQLLLAAARSEGR